MNYWIDKLDVRDLDMQELAQPEKPVREVAADDVPEVADDIFPPGFADDLFDELD